MTDQTAGSSIARRLDEIGLMMVELRAQIELQAGHAEGFNTLLDAQNAQLGSLAGELRTTIAGAAGGRMAEILGRLENVSNALLNIGAMVSELVGGGLAQRLETVQGGVSVLAAQLQAQVGQAEAMNAALNELGAGWRGGFDGMKAQFETAAAATTQISGKLDNISNALLNISAMVSGLVGSGMATQLERMEKLQNDLVVKIDNLTLTLPAISRHIDDELTRHDVSARLTRIERALGEP